MYKSEEQIISEMVGKTFVSVSGKVGDERMDFRTKDGSGVSFYHSQDCCESVDIEDIAGDLNDLLDTPILRAEVRTSSENPEGIPRNIKIASPGRFMSLRPSRAASRCVGMVRAMDITARKFLSLN